MAQVSGGAQPRVLSQHAQKTAEALFQSRNIAGVKEARAGDACACGAVQHLGAV